MAEKEIKLEKLVISNKQARNQLDNSFKEVVISAEKIDDEKLKKIYNSLFYKIPQRGKLSHEEIVIKSDEFVNPQTNINLQGEIEILEQKLKEKNDELNALEAPEGEHAIFSNNTFIQEGDPGQDVTLGNQIWYIQKGLKRKITGDEDFYTDFLRKINKDVLYQANGQKIPIENSPMRQLARADEINTILEAQDIYQGEDISVEPVAKEYLFAQFKVEFECFGRESYYKFSDEERLALSEYGGLDTFTVAISSDWVYGDGSDYKHGYWYLDKEGQCSVTYVNDIDPTIGFTPEQTTVTFGVPGYVKRSVSIDASIYSGDPLNASYYESPNNIQWHRRPPDTFQTAYPVMPYHKEWGPEGKFPSIVNVGEGSRVKVKIVNKRDDGSPIYPRESNPDVEEWTELYGLDDDHHSDWVSIYGEPMGLFGIFDRRSKWSTKMCNNVCYGPAVNDCYGRLNQNWRRDDDDINRRLMKVLGDRNNNYYREDASYNGWLRGKLYGQPILYVENKLMVFMGGRRKTSWSWGIPTAEDQIIFYNVEDGGFRELKQNQLEAKVKGYIRQKLDSNVGVDFLNPPHKQYFQWINPNRESDGSLRGSLNNPTLIYPGLDLGHSLNGVAGGSGQYNQGQEFTDLSGANLDFRSDTLRGLGSGYTSWSVKDRNIFNPGDGEIGNRITVTTVGQGSNIGMTQWMVDNLDFHNPFYASVPPGEEMFTIDLNVS
jgi:hypothetical protein